MSNCIPDSTGTACINCGWKVKKNRPFPNRNCPGPVKPLTDEQRYEIADKMRQSIATLESPGSLTIAEPRLAICSEAKELTFDGCVEKAGCGNCWKKWRERLTDPQGKCPMNKW